MSSARKGGVAPRYCAISAKKIAVLVATGCDLLAVSALVEVLDRANELARDRYSSDAIYELLLLSVKGGLVASNRSLAVSTTALAGTASHRVEYVCLAHGSFVESGAGCSEQTFWLHRMRRCGATFRSLLTGDARATHWNTTADASGGESGQDKEKTIWERIHPALRVAFDIIRLDLGDELALEAMRYAVNNRELAATTNVSWCNADKVRFAARWLRENCDRAFPLADAADACAFSERSLLRHFRTYLGTSPSEYLQQARLELACQMLTNTALPVDKIARRVGLTNGDRFGKILRRVIGMSPTEYRATLCKKSSESTPP